jgi:hypothetical protein
MERSTFVPWLTAVTLAPGITAPSLSKTVPEMEPTACAKACTEAKARTTNRARMMVRFMASPSNQKFYESIQIASNELNFESNLNRFKFDSTDRKTNSAAKVLSRTK